MADFPPYPDSSGDPGNDTAVGPGRGSTPSTPRWVKVFGIIALALVLLFVILHLTGNSLGGHTPSDGGGDHTPPSSVTELGVQ